MSTLIEKGIESRAFTALPSALSFYLALSPLANADNLPSNPSQGQNISGPIAAIDSPQFAVTIIAIGFGLIVVCLQLLSLRRVSTVSADDIARNCAITMVITASIVLIITGYNSNQIAPAFGLFGTIIGYLLGSSNAHRSRPDIATTPDNGEGGTNVGP